MSQLHVLILKWHFKREKKGIENRNLHLALNYHPHLNLKQLVQLNEYLLLIFDHVHVVSVKKKKNNIKLTIKISEKKQAEIFYRFFLLHLVNKKHSWTLLKKKNTQHEPFAIIHTVEKNENFINIKKIVLQMPLEITFKVTLALSNVYV